MSPAFTSTRQAIAFVLIVIALLALPALLPPVDQSSMFAAIPYRYGPFTWNHEQIFKESGDIDIAFVGSSRVLNDINTPYVRDELEKQLGRPAKVITIGWYWAGCDSFYHVARQLLEHRKVGLLVFDDEIRIPDTPHEGACQWFQVAGESELLQGLATSPKIRLYGSAVLGAPRQVLNLLRRNLLEDPARYQCFYTNGSTNVAENLGSYRTRYGFQLSPFAAYEPPGTATPDDVVVYSQEMAEQFKFTGPTAKGSQQYFAQQFGKLCQQHGTHVVKLKFPVYSDRDKTSVVEPESWPDLLGLPLDMCGIAPARLFAGLTDADIQKLYWDNWHLNQNGQDFFTPLVTPALVKLYVQSNSSH